MIVADIAAVVSASAALGAFLIGASNRKKIQQVHVLVNSQLMDVMKKLEIVTAERDHLDPDKTG